MASRDELTETLLTQINKAAASETRAVYLPALPEAFAWVTNPNQPHGSPAASK